MDSTYREGMADKTPEEIVRSIMESTNVATMTYIDDAGRIVATPMGVQKFDEPGTTYWITEKDTDKVTHLGQDPRVNIFFANREGYVSLSGTARVIDDRARLEELWGSFTDAFMEGGPEDPNSTLLEVTADTAQWWDSPGAVASVVQIIKAKVSDDEATDLGDTGVTRI